MFCRASILRPKNEAQRLAGSPKPAKNGAYKYGPLVLVAARICVDQVYTFLSSSFFFASTLRNLQMSKTTHIIESKAGKERVIWCVPGVPEVQLQYTAVLDNNLRPRYIQCHPTIQDTLDLPLTVQALLRIDPCHLQ